MPWLPRADPCPSQGHACASSHRAYSLVTPCLMEPGNCSMPPWCARQRCSATGGHGGHIDPDQQALFGERSLRA
eukprot:13253622-Alexandrium_andersonii.AAC.1